MEGVNSGTTIFQRKLLLFIFAAVAMNGLVFAVFVLGRMSSWVVGDDMLNGRMDRDGGMLEHAVAELLFTPSGVSIEFVTVLFFSVGFLALLWHTLFRSENPKA